MSFLTRICLALGVIGCVVSFLGGRDYWLASKAKSAPDQLTAAQLISRGAEGNPYVEITEFMPATNFVYEEKSGRWTEIFIPFGPLDENAENVTSVKAVFKSTKISSEAEIYSTFGVERIQGMVMNHIESLGSEEKKLLSQSFPGANMADVLIVDVTKNPADMKSRGSCVDGDRLGLPPRLRRPWLCSACEETIAQSDELIRRMKMSAYSFDQRVHRPAALMRFAGQRDVGACSGFK